MLKGLGVTAEFRLLVQPEFISSSHLAGRPLVEQ